MTSEVRNLFHGFWNWPFVFFGYLLTLPSLLLASFFIWWFGKHVLHIKGKAFLSFFHHILFQFLICLSFLFMVFLMLLIESPSPPLNYINCKLFCFNWAVLKTYVVCSYGSVDQDLTCFKKKENWSSSTSD